jgi:hypothetical protein
MNGKIIKIHGCSGAGKTTAVRSLLEMAESAVKLYDGSDQKVEAYQLKLAGVVAPVFVLGSYENNCGGMDTVGDAEEAMLLVHNYESQGHVIHEGLLQSTYYGAMGKDSQRYGDRYIYAFLDTPLELCLERVVARRAKNGSKNKFNPELTADKHRTIANLQRKLLEQKMGVFHAVKVLDHTQAMYPQLVEMLK